jgi:rod shape-determining protein MreD
MRATTAIGLGMRGDTRTEVYRYPPVFVVTAVLAALLLQASLERLGPRAGYIELPLLVTMYFGLSRRNASSGLLLGMFIGLLQDGISRGPIGLFGIAKTVVGFVSSNVGARIDVEHPISRLVLGFVFYYLHQATLALTERVVMGQHAELWNHRVLIGAVINAILAPLLFPLLDRFRKHE